MNRKVAIAIAALFLVGTPASHAKQFKYASQGDPRTLDPHAMNEQVTLMVQQQIYDPLVGRDRNLALEPSLALRWERAGDKGWRFHLRPGVRFHEGQAFTADDVKFSIERAKPGSQFRAFLAHITEVKVIDPMTVEVTTSEFDPLLPSKLTVLNVMSREWSVRNKSEKVSDIGQDKEEIFATRNANGTGPYRLKSREPNVRTILVRNDQWWGKNEGNVTEAIYTPIASAATRIAALLSGEIDMILDTPVQDIPRLERSAGHKLQSGLELRTILLGMDQNRDPPPYLADKAGKPLAKNPFKDRRVRQAFAHAIDVESIVTRVMRGYAIPSGILSIPGLVGYAQDLDMRPKFDLARAKALMAEAGYADGFKVTLLCTNDRYVNDTQVCRAIAAMLAQIGVEVDVDSVTRNVYFSRLLALDTGFYIIGLTSNLGDTFDILQSNLMTRVPPDGQVNFGRWSHREFDAAVNRLKVEPDPAARTDLYRRALTIARDDVGDLRLYHQKLVWGMRKNIDMHIRADNFVILKWVTVN
jgi:peptide/nickel transport system substrate-binding protein